MNLEDNFFKIENNKVPPERGRLLISESYSTDVFFRRAVVLLVEHNDSGSVGFILNKPFAKELKDITDFFDSYTAQVGIGGPVGSSNLYYIHTLGKKIKGSIKVTNELFWGGNYNDVKKLAAADMLDESNIKFFVGYSGWDKGQLDSELKQNYWLVTESNTADVMANPDEIWQKVLSRQEERYRIWSNFPVNPDSN